MAHAWVNVTYMSDADYRAAIEERRKAVADDDHRVAAAVTSDMRTHRFDDRHHGNRRGDGVVLVLG